MTLQDLLADCYRRLDYQAAPASAVVTRLRGFINETQRELAGDVHLAPLSKGTLTLTTTASQAEYGIPPACARIVTLRETTNDRRIRQQSLDWYRWAYPDPATVTGTPDSYVLIGRSSVTRQPTSASFLYAISSSNSDTPILHYEVRLVDGTVATGVCQLSGLASVALSSSLSVEEVLDWYLDDEAVGTVTLSDGSGTELAHINAGQTRNTYQMIAFVPTPSAAITYTLDYERAITDLIVDADAPSWLPEAFHTILAVGARLREYEFRGDGPRYQMAAAEYGLQATKLRRYVNTQPDGMLAMGRHRHGISRLGGYYPADTWVND